MLHAKFPDHRTSGSGEDFKVFISRHGGHLGHVTETIFTKFMFPLPKKVPHLIWPTGVYLLDFFCSGIQFNLLLSPYPCFISLLYLDLYVLGDDALIS